MTNLFYMEVFLLPESTFVHVLRVIEAGLNDIIIITSVKFFIEICVY